MTPTPERDSTLTARGPRTTRQATRTFLILHALRWLPIGFLLPILVLVPTERGLDLPTVGLMFATYGLTTAVLELPTGGLADAIGRKPVLLVATVADTGLLLALAFGATPAQFLIGAVMGGVGRALLSGPLESWYVDTARSIDPQVPLRPGLARAGTVEGVALAAGALLSAVLPTIGAALPVDGVVSQLTLPVYGGLIAQIASFVALAVLLHEPRRRRTAGWGAGISDVPGVVVDGLRLARSTRDLRVLFSTFVVAAVAFVAVEVLWQPRFTALLGGAGRATQTFGYVIVAMSLAAAAGAWLADRLPGVFARRASATAAGGMALAATAMLGLANADTFLLAAAAFAAVYGAGAITSVATREMLHERVPAGRRATLLSVESLCEQTGNVIASLALTRVAAAFGIPFAWSVGAVLLVVVGVLLLFVADDPSDGPTDDPKLVR